MANIDRLRLVAISPAHLDGAMNLVRQAGWNQTANDWRMMIAHGSAFGFEDADEKLVASALVLPYRPGTGWISMVLVTPGHRRKGLAGMLIKRSVKLLHEQELTPFLDATPAGEKVYVKRGFRPVFGFHRWYRAALNPRSSSLSSASGLQAVTDIRPVLEMDRRIFGGGRAPLLADVIARGAPCLIAGDNSGFALSRDGLSARQIGPLEANSLDSAWALFSALEQQTPQPVVVDVPDTHSEFIDRLQEAGFVRQRSLKRMRLGRRKTAAPGQMFALFGPELG